MKGALIACILIAIAGVGGLIWYGASGGAMTDISGEPQPGKAALLPALEIENADEEIEKVEMSEEVAENESEIVEIEGSPPEEDILANIYEENLPEFRVMLNPFVGFEPFSKSWGVGLNSVVSIGHWGLSGGVYKPLSLTYKDTILTMGIAYTW